jgi:uncharacterized protein
MVLEWIRRNNADFAGHLKTYLFTEAPILAVEETQTAAEAGVGPPPAGSPRGEGSSPRFTVGPLKGE